MEAKQTSSTSKPKRTVIFDGECEFCQSWIKRGKAFDWFKVIDWRARLEPGLAAEFPQTGKEETKNRIVSICPDGKALGGFFAMRDIMLRLPVTFLPALLMHLPGAGWIGEPVYQWISRNRHRFKSCKI